jgi:restriction system protein
VLDGSSARPTEHNGVMTAWRDYQEQVAQFFRDLGLAAETDVTVHGPRTSHDVDVLVRFDHVGFEVTWIVECKHWQAPVSKLHVLALRTIVSEAGADRGMLMAERGFQRGAVEAAELTNVRLTSLAELSQTAGHAIGMAQLRALQERVDTCKARYWALPKDHRIAQGLRPEVGAPGYSGTAVMEAVQSALNGAFRRQFQSGTTTWLWPCIRSIAHREPLQENSPGACSV